MLKRITPTLIARVLIAAGVACFVYGWSLARLVQESQKQYPEKGTERSYSSNTPGKIMREKETYPRRDAWRASGLERYREAGYWMAGGAGIVALFLPWARRNWRKTNAPAEPFHGTAQADEPVSRPAQEPSRSDQRPGDRHPPGSVRSG